MENSALKQLEGLNNKFQQVVDAVSTMEDQHELLISKIEGVDTDTLRTFNENIQGLLTLVQFLKDHQEKSIKQNLSQIEGFYESLRTNLSHFDSLVNRIPKKIGTVKEYTIGLDSRKLAVKFLVWLLVIPIFFYGSMVGQEWGAQYFSERPYQNAWEKLYGDFETVRSALDDIWKNANNSSYEGLNEET